MHSEPQGSVLRVVRGAPTPEELAAVVTVVLARRQGAPAVQPVSRWRDREAGLRTALRSGPGAWRAAGSPR